MDPPPQHIRLRSRATTGIGSMAGMTSFRAMQGLAEKTFKPCFDKRLDVTDLRLSPTFFEIALFNFGVF
ncbi:hypothetical protein B0B52_03095 [Polaromonas sp. A23]|nr:hypothetical protein B0B52_03095 [Polaromonas sp. A23]